MSSTRNPSIALFITITVDHNLSDGAELQCKMSHLTAQHADELDTNTGDGKGETVM